ncbi:MAG TPA: EamA family transporter [Chryseolinea sp.]
MNHQKNYIAGVAAFVIWGFFSIPLRALQNFSAGEILYFRILFSALSLLLVILLFKRKDVRHDWQLFGTLSNKQKNTVVLLTLAGGALLCVNWLTFIYIVNAINVKTASFAYLICPVITAVLGYVLIKERLTALQWFAVALCTVSCVLIGISSALELGYSFLTAFTYALYLITQRKNQGFDRIIGLGIQILFSFFLLNLVFGYLVESVPTDGKFYGVIIIIAVVFTVVPLFLNLFALNKINSATIGILMYINPIFNFTIAFLVFNEKINFLQVVGYSIIILALAVFNFQNFRKLQTTVSAKRIA